MLTPYQDKDGNTIYPYNAQWVQQPIVRADERYKPVVRKPDAILMKMELIESGNKARLTIRNAGSATINANTPITFYNGGSNGVAPASGNKIVEKPVGVDIFPEETYTRDYDLGVDIKNKLIHARIMDSNNKFPADNYTDCELSNNVIATAYCPELAYSITASSNKICADGGTVTLTAKKDGTLNAATYKWYHDDVEINSATGSTYAATQAGRYTCYVTSGAICRTHSSEKIITLEQKNAINDAITLDALAPTSINVIANDYIPASCTSPNVNIIVQPKHGVATVVGNQIEYTSTVNADIKDTLAYSLTADATIWAELYIVIKSVPVPVAVNDYATVFACYPRTVKALANDYDATGGTVKIVTDGKLGTATLAGSNSDEIQYTASKGSNCFANGGKNDTVTYSICLGNVCNAEGKLIMTVLRLPYIMLMDKCSHRPYLTPAYQYHGATYQWYSAPKNAPTAWQPVSGGAGAGMKLYVTAEAYYKLEVTYNGEVVETQPVHFVVNRQAKLPTGIWYDSTLN